MVTFLLSFLWWINAYYSLSIFLDLFHRWHNRIITINLVLQKKSFSVKLARNFFNYYIFLIFHFFDFLYFLMSQCTILSFFLSLEVKGFHLQFPKAHTLFGSWGWNFLPQMMDKRGNGLFLFLIFLPSTGKIENSGKGK